MKEVREYCEGDIDGTFVNYATQRNGKRCSAAEGFLKPAMGRPNLQVHPQGRRSTKSCSRTTVLSVCASSTTAGPAISASTAR